MRTAKPFAQTPAGNALRPVRYRVSANVAALALAMFGLSTATSAQAPSQQPVPRPKAAAAAPSGTPSATAPRPARAAPPAPSAAADVGADVVARVSGRDVTVAEVRTFVAGLGAEQQAALSRDPALLSQSLRLMLANQLVLKEANKKKWQDQPAVAAQLARLRDAAIVETYLQSVSGPPGDYPDDAEVQKAYDANKTAFVVPRQFKIAQIFVALEKGGADKAAEDRARKKLADIQARLKQPNADFSAIAKDVSDHRDVAERGGEIGWVAETQLRPEIKSQIMGLAKNAVSEPIQLDDGWHIVKLIETKAATTRSLAEVRDLLVQRLRAQRAEGLRRSYLARLIEQTPPAINEIALGRVFDAKTVDGPVR